MAGITGRSGRKPFVPTADHRNTVKVMKGLGIPEEQICLTVINPTTGRPLSRRSLEVHFKRELATGATEMTALVGNWLVNSILGRKPPSGEPVKNDQARMTGAIFYLKTRGGWKETQINELMGKDGRPLHIWQHYPEDAGL